MARIIHTKSKAKEDEPEPKPPKSSKRRVQQYENFVWAKAEYLKVIIHQPEIDAASHDEHNSYQLNVRQLTITKDIKSFFFTLR